MSDSLWPEDLDVSRPQQSIWWNTGVVMENLREVFDRHSCLYEDVDDDSMRTWFKSSVTITMNIRVAMDVLFFDCTFGDVLQYDSRAIISRVNAINLNLYYGRFYLEPDTIGYCFSYKYLEKTPDYDRLCRIIKMVIESIETCATEIFDVFPEVEG